MSSLLIVNNYSEFQVKIFSNNRDIRLYLESSKSKKGHNFVKKWRITSPTGMGSPFDSEQLFWGFISVKLYLSCFQQHGASITVLF